MSINYDILPSNIITTQLNLVYSHVTQDISHYHQNLLLQGCYTILVVVVSMTAEYAGSVCYAGSYNLKIYVPTRLCLRLYLWRVYGVILIVSFCHTFPNRRDISKMKFGNTWQETL